MATYEEHILVLEDSDLPEETVEAAAQAISFAAYLRNFYVVTGVLNEEAPIDCRVLEGLIDAFHGELAAAAIILSEDSFKGVPELLRSTEVTMVDPENAVPEYVRKGFGRLASRIEKAREERVLAFKAFEEYEKSGKSE